MSGGLLDALERLDDTEMMAAVAGYRYFGLDSAASVVEAVAQEVAPIDPGASPDVLDQLEPDADLRYATAVPDDSTIVRAFEVRLQRRPEEFAPIHSGD
jgi:hypothetical protein